MLSNWGGVQLVLTDLQENKNEAIENLPWGGSLSCASLAMGRVDPRPGNPCKSKHNQKKS